MSEDAPTLESFAVTLEKLKLPKTANIFREELEKKNNLQRIEKTLASNPLVSKLMQKLDAPRFQNKKLNNKEESKRAEDNILNSKSNMSMLETKIFKKLYENFDNHKINIYTSETKCLHMKIIVQFSIFTSQIPFLDKFLEIDFI